MAKPSGFVVVMGSYTPVCLGRVHKDPFDVDVADVSFDGTLSASLWRAINPRIIAGEGWCDVGHIAPILCNDQCPVEGTITLDPDGLQRHFFLTCLPDPTGGAA